MSKQTKALRNARNAEQNAERQRNWRNRNRNGKTTTPVSEEPTQFETEFRALPTDLKAFWLELCQNEASVKNGDWQEDFAAGRHLEEMLREWQLFYAQPASVRAAWLRLGKDRSPGAFAKWLR
jgi:hypothetical protein